MTGSILEDWRTPLIVAAVVLAAMFLGVHTTGRLYPIGLATFLVGLIALTGITLKGGSFISVLTSAISLGIGYRFVVNYFTTPIGTSPQIQPARMDLIIETGSVAESGTGFYGDAPIHFLLGGMSGAVFGTSAYEAIFLYAVLIGVVLPLVVIGLCYSIGIRDKRALLLAAILAVCTTEAIRRSYWIVPQTTGSIFWWLSIFALAKHVSVRDPRWFGVLTIFATLGVVTHKLPPSMLMGVAGVLLLLLLFDRITWSSIGNLTPIRQLVGLCLLIGSLMLVQWVYVGSIFGNIVTRFFRLFTETGAIEGGSGEAETGLSGVEQALPGVTAYIIEYPSVFSLFVERGHGIWLVLAAGFGWAYLYLFATNENHRSAVQVLLAGAAVGVALLPLGVIAISGLNPTRIMILIEPVLVVLIIAFIWRARSVSGLLTTVKSWFGRSKPDRVAVPDGGSDQPRLAVKLWRTLLVVIFVLLLVSQVFAASAAPDYANSPRYYADAPEAQAETTFCEITDERIYADNYYNRFTDAERGDCSAFQSIGRSDTSPLYNATITPEKHGTFAYRTEAEVYLGDGGDRWRLTWDPEVKLATEYNTIYDNDAVVLFSAPESAQESEDR